MLRWEEEMQYKEPGPVWNVKNVIILFFFVRGGHDLVKMAGNRVVVAFLPVEQSICLSGWGVEVVQTANSHYPCIMCYKCFIQSELSKLHHDTGDVAVSAFVVVSKEENQDAQVTVEEARMKSVGLGAT